MLRNGVYGLCTKIGDFMKPAQKLNNIKGSYLIMPDHLEIHIHTDGASRGNPGSSSIGIVFLNSNREFIAEYKECIGVATNNVAEYTAIIKALELATAYCRKKVTVWSDSEIVVKQLNGLQ